MKVEAKVKKVYDDYVILVFNKTEKCKKCEAFQFCKFTYDDKIEIKAKKKTPMKEGDTVWLEIPENKAIFLSFLIFILPLINAGIFYLIGTFFNLKNFLKISLAILGFGLSFVVLHFFEKRKIFEPIAYKK